MRIMILRKITNQGLLSLIMVLVMIAPAQQPVPSGPPRPQVLLAQRTQPRSPLGQTPAGVALQVAAPLPGQSTTVLPDGSSLILGGTLVSNSVASARVGSTVLSSTLVHARAWHTATVLPDGSVFIFGGLDGQALVPESEIFSPPTQTFSPLSSTTLAPRAFHTATLLTDGQVLIAGGTDGTGQPFGTLDLWDPKTKTAQRVQAQLAQPRRSHTATLQADGTVRIEGGVSADGSPATQIEIFDPNALTLSTIETTPPSPADLSLVVSIPADASKGVSLDSLIALRFSRPLDAKSVNAATATIRDQNGPLAAQAISAEAGMLAFVNVAGGLQSDTNYTVSVNGASDKNGFPLPPSAFSFSTKSTPVANAAKSNTPADQEDPPVPPLQAGPNVTAVSGIVRTVAGKYLPQVTLELNCGEEKARRLRAVSDGTGRFLIANTPSGHCKLEIDGTTVNRGSEVYGIFTPGVNINTGSTNVLPYTIWMTPLDIAHAVNIPSPTGSELVVTNPAIPGLELHLPPNATVKDYDGNVIHQLSITQIPVGRPPFPLPAGAPVPLYFTVQPGGSYIEVTGDSSMGARLFYPNRDRAPAGYKFSFWNYDPDNKGWYIYGTGQVDANRRSIVPDPGVSIYQFTGAMVANPLCCAPPGPNPPPPPQCPPDCPHPDGDPVDPAAGTFLYSAIDFMIPDVLTLTLTRRYRQGDPISHAFGVGMNHNYDMYLIGDTFPYTYIDLILSDGSRVHFNRTSPGTSYTDAIYETTANTAYYKAKINWNAAITGWTMTLKDGSAWTFADGFSATLPTQGAILSMKDRYGNTTTMTRDTTTGRLLKVSSPNARSISFTYDSGNRVTRATDNSGRHYDYTYDAGGRLATVTDPMNGITQYAYDANNQMLTIIDPRGHTHLTTQYDTSGRVSQQTMADGGIWHFAYTQDGNGNIIQTDVTNPRGFINRYNYNTNGYFSGGQLVSNTMALGQPEQQTMTYNRDASGLLTGITDPLGRITNYSYDLKRNIQTVTRAFGTADAATTSYTYDPNFNRTTSLTDPLSHTTNFAIDQNTGNMTSIIDPLGYQVSLTYNSAGQPLTMLDSASGTTFTYTLGLLATTADLLGDTFRMVYDSLGRVITKTDPVGGTTRLTYDLMDRVTDTTDPAQSITHFAYDPNGNQLSVTDARQNSTTYTYTSMDQQDTRTDALTKSENRTYDLNGNLVTFTDRKGQLTTYTFDALDRVTLIQYQDQSTTALTYDGGNRLTQVVDSLSGTITRTYDNLNRLTNETTPMGSLSYAYDAASHRVAMTVAGQPTVTYTYDIAGKLTQITQGTSIVTYAYDPVRRVSALTLPNGIARGYAYDGASRVTSLSYALGASSLGNLTYAYDATGRRISMGGSLAATNLPQAVSSAAYNANSQLTQWGTAAISYDLNGNMTNDGTNSFSWDVRNQMSSTNGAPFGYDAAGRRTQNAAGTKFSYDGVNAVQEIVGSSVTANLLTGLGIDERYTRADSSGTSSFVVDALGSTLALADSSGTVQTPYRYGAFGLTTASGAASANTFQYTGREDDGGGLYYYRARYYSSVFQRFISEDPLGQRSGDVNLYAYVSDDPIDYIDPQGLIKIYGKWCGPDWTGGRVEEYHPERDQGKYYERPENELDEACESHDKGYSYCRQAHPCDKASRAQCMTKYDRVLASTSQQIALSYPKTTSGGTIGDAAAEIYWWFRNNSPMVGPDQPDCCKRGR